MTKKTDAELSKCYGRQSVRKLQSGGYQTSCHEECPLFDACISKSREEMEDIERQNIQIPYSSLIMTKKEKENMDEDSFFEKMASEYTDQYDGFDFLLNRFKVSVNLRPFAVDFIRRFAHFYNQCPDICHAIMRKIFKGENQSDIARERQITRQAFSYRIMKEAAGIMRAEIPHIPEELQGIEVAVYRLCFVDGCTERSAAIQLNMAKTKIHRIREAIASK